MRVHAHTSPFNRQAANHESRSQAGSLQHRTAPHAASRQQNSCLPGKPIAAQKRFAAMADTRETPTPRGSVASEMEESPPPTKSRRIVLSGSGMTILFKRMAEERAVVASQSQQDIALGKRLCENIEWVRNPDHTHLLGVLRTRMKVMEAMLTSDNVGILSCLSQMSAVERAYVGFLDEDGFSTFADLKCISLRVFSAVHMDQLNRIKDEYYLGLAKVTKMMETLRLIVDHAMTLMLRDGSSMYRLASCHSAK